MSDTPLTDEAASDGWTGDAVCVDVEFSRSQERRIAELERLLDVERRAVAAANQSADVALKWEADAKKAGRRVDELECGIKGCVLPRHHHLLPEAHPHRWCSTTWINP